MIIDLHNHTRLYSHCSKLDPRWLIEEAVKKQLPGIALTEHDRYFDRQKADELEISFDNKIKIFVGIEVTAGEDHVLLFGEKINEGYRHNGLELLFKDTLRSIRWSKRCNTTDHLAMCETFDEDQATDGDHGRHKLDDILGTARKFVSIIQIAGADAVDGAQE